MICRRDFTHYRVQNLQSHSFTFFFFTCCMTFLLDLDPPRDLEQIESTETSVTLKWQKPRAKVTGYKLVYVSKDGQVDEVEIPASATSYVLTNLTPGMGYSLSLTAERGHRRSTPVTLSTSTGG